MIKTYLMYNKHWAATAEYEPRKFVHREFVSEAEAIKAVTEFIKEKQRAAKN